MMPPVLLGDGEREDGIIIADADAFLLDVDAAINRGSIKSATDAGHAEAPAAVASTTRTILSGASALSPPFAGGVFEVRAIWARRGQVFCLSHKFSASHTKEEKNSSFVPVSPSEQRRLEKSPARRGGFSLPAYIFSSLVLSLSLSLSLSLLISQSLVNKLARSLPPKKKKRIRYSPLPPLGPPPPPSSKVFFFFFKRRPSLLVPLADRELLERGGSALSPPRRCPRSPRPSTSRTGAPRSSASSPPPSPAAAARSPR